MARHQRNTPDGLMIACYVVILDVIGFDFCGLASNMAEDDRVVTAKLPDHLVSQMDEVAGRIDRSKSWIVRQAVTEWLAEEQRRYELTLEALKDVDEGRTIPHEEVLAMVEERKHERREARGRSAA